MNAPSPPLIAAKPRGFTLTSVALILAGLAALLILRLPGPWAQGRFQDEEATVFLAYAWHFPWHEALLRPFGGYLNLAANLTTLVVARAAQSGGLALENAPYLTMVAGLFAQLLMLLLLLTGEARWLSGQRERAVMALAIALTPAIEEVLFNVMHIQFHLALASALILALDVPRSRLARAAYSTLLFVAPLCGPGAILLLPLLLLRALVERARGRWWQFAALALGASIQLGFFYSNSPARGISLPLAELPAAMANRLVVMPLLGVDAASAVAARVGGAGMLIAGLAVLLLAFVGTLGAAAARRRDGSLWLLGGALLMLGVTLAIGLATTDPQAAFQPYAGSRHNYIPQALLACVIAAGWRGGPGNSRPLAYSVMLTAFLIAGIIAAARPSRMFDRGPDWRSEVKAWRADPSHRLAVWPAPFVADLSPQATRCRPPVAPGDATQPRYCESGWIAHFYAPRRR